MQTSETRIAPPDHGGSRFLINVQKKVGGRWVEFAYSDLVVPRHLQPSGPHRWQPSDTEIRFNREATSMLITYPYQEWVLVRVGFAERMLKAKR